MNVHTPLSTEIAIARAAIDLIRQSVGEDDPDYLAIVENEVDALETLRRMLRRARRAEAEAEAVAHMRKELTEELKDREERHLERADSLRRAVRWAIEELKLPKGQLTAPDFTATVHYPTHGAVEIPDPEAVPSEFCRVVKTPDKAKIKELLDGGMCPNWATFGPPKPRLTVRSR